MKRKLSALFIALLLVSQMTACSGSEPTAETDDTPANADNTANVKTAEATETDETDDLPGMDYGGADVMVYAEGYLTNDYHNFYNIYEETGSVVNDAAYQRNRAIEERFNVQLGYTDDAVKEDMSVFKNSVAAGAMEFDLVSGIGTFLTQCISAGYLQDLNALQYVNLDKSYYQRYINEEMEMLGKQFTASGYFDMATMARTAVTFFSTKLAVDFGLGDLYSLVGSNEWTFDTMLSLASAASVDTNGDGAMTEEDQYGLCGGYNMNSLLIVSTGYRFTTKNDDGTRRSTGYTEGLLDFNKLLMDTYAQDWYYNCYVYGDKNHFSDVAIPNFMRDQYLFFLFDISWAQSFAAEMDDYGILPIPKYQADQKEYMSYCRPAMTAVPSDAEDPERSGILLEALNYESKKVVLPAYYDIALSSRYATSPEASDILDIIFANVACDFAQNWYSALSLTPPLHTSIGIREDYVSYYAGIQKSFDEKLDAIFEAVKSTTEG